jgi:hypothetical protein
MRVKKMFKRKIIIDVGAREESFMRKLRNDKREVIGIDKESQNPRIVKKSMGDYFNTMNQKTAERLHAIWLNHINIRTTEAHKELVELTKKLPPGTPIILTIRKQNLLPVKNSLKHAGLNIVGEKPVTKKMLTSLETEIALEESRRDPEKTPIRIIAMKPRSEHQKRLAKKHA